MSAPRHPLTLVVAMTPNRVIGRNNTIPWDLPEDRKHFVNVTRGHAIIMGRATWDSIGKPLPKRRNIVVTRNRTLTLAGAEVVHSLDEAIARARETDDDPRIMGGTQLYEASLPQATRIYLTQLNFEVEGDTYFPDLDMREWTLTESTPGDRVTYQTLVRR